MVLGPCRGKASTRLDSTLRGRGGHAASSTTRQQVIAAGTTRGRVVLAAPQKSARLAVRPTFGDLGWFRGVAVALRSDALTANKRKRLVSLPVAGDRICAGN